MKTLQAPFDPALTPISIRGSWMSIGRLTGHHATRGEGLYLRTNRCRPLAHRPVLRFVVPGSAHGADLLETGTIRAQPGCVRVFEHADDAAPALELVFDGPATIRIRCRRMLRLEAAYRGSNDRENAVHAVVYSEAQDRFVFNARVWLRRYGVEVLSGTAGLDAVWDGELSEAASLTVEPGESGICELAVDEFRSTWVRQSRDDFDACASRLESDWRTFVATFSPGNDGGSTVGEAGPADELTTTRSAALMWMCTQGPSGNLSHETIFMSLNWMDSVWSWDNWINMVALASAQPDLAYAQFQTVAAHQDEYGAYPDQLNDGFLHFNFSKPPVQSVIIELIERLEPDFWTEARRREVFSSVARFTEWWLRYRRAEGHRLCHYLHGNDSGWDNGTLTRKGVPVITPDLNAFVAHQCRFLAEWGRRLGEAVSDTTRWDERAAALEEALVSELWRGDRFVAHHIPSGRDVDSVSLATVLPLVIADRLPRPVVEAMLARARTCETEWGLASEAPSSPYYEAENYWRGPIWPPTTLIGVHALRRMGEHDFADRVASAYLRMVEKSGFPENFHAQTGDPLVDPGYTWTAAVYLALSRDLVLSGRAGPSDRVPPPD